MLKHSEIPAGKRARILHHPGGMRLASSLLLGECLLRHEKDRVLGISIYDGYAEYLKPFLGGSTAGPEPVNAWGFLSGLRDVARIDGYCNALSLCRV